MGTLTQGYVFTDLHLQASERDQLHHRHLCTDILVYIHTVYFLFISGL